MTRVQPGDRSRTSIQATPTFTILSPTRATGTSMPTGTDTAAAPAATTLTSCQAISGGAGRGHSSPDEPSSNRGLAAFWGQANHHQSPAHPLEPTDPHCPSSVWDHCKPRSLGSVQNTSSYFMLQFNLALLGAYISKAKKCVNRNDKFRYKSG